RLRDFSRKQDGAVIQNLVLTARERLGAVLRRTAERGAALEEARKRTKQLCAQGMALPVLLVHPALGFGSRCPSPAGLCRGAAGWLSPGAACIACTLAHRQHKLEENLLFSGKFTDALQALMDWLYRAEPQLSEDVPVGGDRDLVGDLMDKHKVFQKELGKRASCVKMLKRSVRDLTRGSSSVDSQWLQQQMEELGGRWDLVCALSVSKQARLEAALRQAEEFHSLVQSFLGRLSESEQALRYGVCPEEETAVQEVLCLPHGPGSPRRLAPAVALALGCAVGRHTPSPPAPAVAQLPARCPQVLSWAQQQGERLQAQTASLAAEREETAQLLDWITAAEEALGLRDQEPLPEEAEQLEELSAQHAVFMEELNRKQPDVEKVTKSCKRKLATELGAPAARRLATRKSPPCPPLPPLALEPQTPLMAQLLHRWQQLWLLALDRQYRLETALQRLRELEEFAHFDFGVWRKRYMQWIGQMKSRVLDVFRGIDRDQDGRISQREFIESVLASSACAWGWLLGHPPGLPLPPQEPGEGQFGEQWGSSCRGGIPRKGIQLLPN
uniref:EF-hand domain-containing protein n=1 Tax=Otus sunia TaxID=257818 RepID=A0A8C8A9M3_9STRI